MQSTAKLDLAKALAAYAHRNQVDKAGKAYILHPLTVSQKLSNETDMIVGLLHDVLEDTDITEATIRNLFGDEIADALVAMTHMPGVPYEDYVRGIAQNPVSRRVKIADLEHNMDMSRLHEVTQKDLKRLEKYQRAKEYLLSADNEFNLEPER